MLQPSPEPHCTPAEGNILAALRRRPILKAADLALRFDLSRMTVYRVLNKLQALRSFNHNSAFCTLPSTPRFDANGLWFYRSIGFSRHHTLTKTLVVLVHDAASGATSDELTNLLRTPVGNLLAGLARQQQLARRRLGHRVVYLASDPQRQEQQWTLRLKDSDPHPTVSTLPANLSPTTVLSLLAELIRSPQHSIDQLARTLLRQSVPIDPADVQAILAFYHLEKKEAR